MKFNFETPHTHKKYYSTTPTPKVMLKHTAVTGVLGSGVITENN